VILFGVSMGYHMFVVSRIRAAHEAGLATARALPAGIRAAAGVVISSTAIMVAVFAVFATLSMQDFKQLGVCPAIAILAGLAPRPVLPGPAGNPARQGRRPPVRLP
jgi:putative drug exporter of the RND superfamily